MLKKIFLLCLLLAACGKTPKMERNKPLLLVSIAPYEFLTRQIAGEEFEIRTVVPVSTNPHSFEPTARQVASVSDGAAWFCIGEGFEKKIIPILKGRNPDLVVVDLREGIELIEEENHLGCKSCSMDHLDRHIWLSPRLMKEQAALVERALSETFPDKKGLFQGNLEQLAIGLDRLNEEIGELLQGVEQKTILVSHPAFGYFCKEYGLTQLSVEYEGKDPRPKHLEEILKRAVAESMELALALPQYNNKGAQLIAEKLHVPVHMIDPYSADYFETMRRLAHLIADAYAN